jgi:hypothetical protein
MLYDLAGEAAAAESVGSSRRLPPADAASLAHLEAVLTEDVAVYGTALGVALTEGCGAIEVRVSGPTAGLRLLFDRAELHPPYVRQAVRKAVTRYRSALGCRSSSLGKE